MFQRLTRMPGRWTRTRFERSVQRLLPELYRTARALVHEPADAEDLVHDSCVKAFRAFSGARFDCEAACRAWLHRILVNTYRDRYRREMRSPTRTAAQSPGAEGDNVVELAASPEPGPSTQLEYDDFSDAAEAAIAALPPEVRIVTALYVIDGLTYKEIATISECPMGTVMSRLARGRQALRQSLTQYLSPGGRDAREGRSRPDTNNRGSGSC